MPRCGAFRIKQNSSVVTSARFVTWNAYIFCWIVDSSCLEGTRLVVSLHLAHGEGRVRVPQRRSQKWRAVFLRFPLVWCAIAAMVVIGGEVPNECVCLSS